MRKIAFITDIHLDEQFPIDNNVIPTKNFETVITDIEKRKINEVIFDGDIGELSAHKCFFDKLQNISLTVLRSSNKQ